MSECKQFFQEFSDYEFISYIGKGSFGSVIKSKNIKDGKFYALKQFDKKNVIRRGLMNYLLREIVYTTAIQHPNVVRAYGVTESSSSFYLIMEFVDGINLDNFIKAHENIPESILKKIYYSCVEGLNYIHKFGIIHRDIKPGNILISNKGEIKLCDFGVSKILGEEKSTSSCGTTLFMSPEMLEHKPYGFDHDYWSLSVTLFFALLKDNPVKDVKTFTELINLLKVLDLMIKETVVTYSEELKDFLMKTLRYDNYYRLKCYNDVIRHSWYNPNYDEIEIKIFFEKEESIISNEGIESPSRLIKEKFNKLVAVLKNIVWVNDRVEFPEKIKDIVGLK